MPFIALCPHCRSARVQAPKRKQGFLHKCPKCQQSFPLEPLDESSLPVDYKLPPVEYDISEAYKQTPGEDFAAAPTTVEKPLEAPTSATPSEVLPVAPPELKSTTIQKLDYTPNVTGPDPPLVFALVSGGLFGLAILLTQLTQYGRIIAVPLLLAGLALGYFALSMLESGRKKFGWAAISVNVLGLLLVLFGADWLRIGGWVPEGDPNAGPKPALSVPRNGGPSTPADWVDAYTALWQQDDVRVDVAGVRFEPLDPKAKKAGPPPKKVLRIVLKVSNTGVARAVPITGWPPEVQPRLTLASGPAVAFTKVETELPATLMPGKDVELTLLFEQPTTLAETLSLELPAAGLGVQENVRFTIPAAMIAKP